MRVALTRSQEDIQKDRKIFEEQHFEVVELPLIEEKVLDFKVPDMEFDLVVFQSPRAVRLFLSRYKLKGERVLAVGEKTAKEVERFGYSVWAKPENYYGEELVAMLKGLSGRVLIPRSAVGRDEVIDGLRGLGFEVVPVEVYSIREKIYKKEELLNRLAKVDAVVFASPSAVRGLLANLQKEEIQRVIKDNKITVCIGKTTQNFFQKELGLTCHIPEKPTMEKVVELLKKMA